MEAHWQKLNLPTPLAQKPEREQSLGSHQFTQEHQLCPAWLLSHAEWCADSFKCAAGRSSMSLRAPAEAMLVLPWRDLSAKGITSELQISENLPSPNQQCHGPLEQYVVLQCPGDSVDN